MPSGDLLVTLGGDGGSKLYDAVDLISTRQLSKIPGRKAIIALTDGEGDGSERTLNEAVRSALEADAIFFGIHRKEKADVRLATGRENLKTLSSQTGGSAFHIDEHTTLEAALRAIEEELRSQYAIGYPPPVGAKRGTFHKEEVRVKKPGLTVRVRSGYSR